MLKRFREEFPLFLAAMLVGFVIWLMAKQSSMESEQVMVKVTIEEIPNVIAEHTPASVPVMVKFPPSQRARVVQQNFEIRIDLRKEFGEDPIKWAWDGKSDTLLLTPIPLSLNNVHTINLPQSIRVTELGPPSRVQVQVKLVTRSLPIKVETTGKLPANYELNGAIKVEPADILVTAPRSVLARTSEPGLSEATAGPVNLSDRTADFSESIDVKVPVGLQVVDETRRVAQVFVSIKEQEKQATIEPVPIQLYVLAEGMKTQIAPPEAKVRIKGRISLVDKVDATMFVFSTKTFLPEEPGVYKDIELEAAFAESVPADIRDNVVIEGFAPVTVTVEHKKAEKK